MTDILKHALIPMQEIGPLMITGPVMNDEVMVPLATFESPLWPSTNRGARITLRSGGIRCTVIDERMTRSVLVQAPDATQALEVLDDLQNRFNDMDNLVRQSSRYARLIDHHSQVTGNLIFLRLEFSTGDAAGHNMVTKAADRILAWLLNEYSHLQHVSVSGNYCTDKKNSAVNGILGRGKNVVAEVVIPEKLCRRYLKALPREIVDLHIKKNLIGGILAGSVRSANAHFANMLLGFYLATGQDAANIVEGSQGIVHTEVKDGELYFSVTLPNLIVGTIGAGKNLEFVQKNLQALGCLAERPTGENARRLAAIAAATVLCGELSLLAAQTNQGELMHTHESMER